VKSDSNAVIIAKILDQFSSSFSLELNYIILFIAMSYYRQVIKLKNKRYGAVVLNISIAIILCMLNKSPKKGNSITLKSWQKGALIGGIIGVIGTLITIITGDISIISLPVVIIFAYVGYGLLFLSPLIELFTVVVFYAVIGAIIGHLIWGRKA
jgi:hypothetical protein